MRKLLSFGFFIMSMILTAQKNNYAKQIELTDPAEEAWQLITDVSQWKHWDSHVVDAQLKGNLLDNSKGTILTSGSKIVDFEIVDFKEGESYTLRHKLSSGMLYLKRSIGSSEKGTILKLSVWFKRLSTKNFRKYMGNDYELVLEKELQNFVQLLE